MKHARLLLFLTLLVSGGAAADNQSQLRDAGSLGGIRLAGTDDPTVSKVYIVQLKAPSAADYHASVIRATSKAGHPAVRKARMNKANDVIRSYTAHLAEEQNKVLARAGTGAELIYRYQ